MRVFQKSFECVSRKFLECFKKVLRVFQESFEGVSRKFGGCIWEASWISIECFKEVSRAFHECFKMFCFEVLLLKASNRSYQSRRRACYLRKNLYSEASRH